MNSHREPITQMGEASPYLLHEPLRLQTTALVFLATAPMINVGLSFSPDVAPSQVIHDVLDSLTYTQVASICKLLEVMYSHVSISLTAGTRSCPEPQSTPQKPSYQ